MLAKLFYSMIWPTIFKKIHIQIISNGKLGHSIFDTLFSLYFANNPKSILHQIPPFYVKQFSVLESLHF